MPYTFHVKSILPVIMLAAAIILPGCSSGDNNVVIPPTIQEDRETPKIASRYRDPEINLVIHTAWDHYIAGRYEPALLDFERLIAKGYRHYDVLYGAGISSLKYYDMKKAIRYLTMCIETYPSHYEARFYRSEAYRNLREYPKARADLEFILTLKPDVTFICGSYPSEYADRAALKRRQDEAKNLLQSI